MIDIDNVFDILITSDKCCSEVLEILSLDFISQNKNKIITNQEIDYTKKLEDYPNLMFKIIKKLAGK